MNKKVGIVESVIEVHHRGHRILLDAAGSSKAVVVWIVGISGFLLVNANSIWERVLGTAFF